MLRNRAESYLSKLDDHMGSLDSRTLASLPLFLRERYALYSTKLFGRVWHLAVEAEGWDPGTPKEYREHWQRLKLAIGEDHVALVLPFVSATVRNRMVRMGIPFLIPDTQVFLPESMVLLAETYGNPPPETGKPLSPAAQALLLIQVQKGGLEELSAKELSATLGYSRASMSNATVELEQNQLCKTYRKGKEQRISFNHSGKALWEMALPLLRSPVRKTQFVTWDKPSPDTKLAGISALAQQSQLAEDPIPTFALPEKLIREGLEQGLFHGCADRYGADAQLEAWRYAPSILSDGRHVDALSLYLSLRKNPDERVQAALADMMEAFPWR
jgi:DNA-binding MarR family transcriptional regulator